MEIRGRTCDEEKLHEFDRVPSSEFLQAVEESDSDLTATCTPTGSFISDSSSPMPSPRCPQRGRKVRFADDVDGGYIEEVREVESFKDDTRYTRDELIMLEQEWHECLLEQLEDAQARPACLERLEGLVLQLASSEDGCAVVQRALELVQPGAQMNMLISELYGNVRQLLCTQAGCAVLDTCLEVMDPASVGFITMEVTGVACRIACLEHGHQVLCRLVEVLPPAGVYYLVCELLQGIVELTCHVYGSYVVQTLIECGTWEQKQHVAFVLAANAHIIGTNAAALDVMQTALVHCSGDASAYLHAALQRPQW
jgi:hypothetical protein